MPGVIATMAEAAALVCDGDHLTYVGYLQMERVAFFHELLRGHRVETLDEVALLCGEGLAAAEEGAERGGEGFHERPVGPV